MRLIKTTSISLLSIFFLYSCTPTKPGLGNSKGKKVYRSIKSSKIFDQHYYGLHLMDAVSGEVLYSERAHQQFTPASLTKLYTYALGKKILPSQMPFVDYVINGDTAIIWPYGDPEFLNPHFSQRIDLIDSLNTLAKYLIISNAQFKDERFGVGWAWDDYAYSFQTEKSSFPVHGNIASFKLVDKQTHKVEVRPTYYGNWLAYRPSIGGEAFTVKRADFANAFDYNIGPDAMEGKKVLIPVSSDKYSLSRLLNELLGKPLDIQAINKENHSDYCTIYGIATDSLYEVMLKESDNHIAEQLMLATAYILSDTQSTSISTQYAMDSLFTFLPDKMYYVDGSGLSRYNSNTPANTTALLAYLYGIDEGKILRHLPKGDIRKDDLNKILKGEKTIVDKNISSNIFIKTGSMKGVYNFSGYLRTKQGRILCFAWMNNHSMTSSREIGAQMLETLAVIYHHY